MIGFQVVTPDFFRKGQIEKELLGRFFLITGTRRNEDRSFNAEGLDRKVRFVVVGIMCGQKVDVVCIIC